MDLRSYAKALASAAVVSAALGCGGSQQAPERPGAAPATTALVERAEAQELSRRYDRARALYQRAVREAPDARSSAWAARRYASALIHWGELEEAEATLERVVELEPGRVSAWHDLGVLRARRGASAAAEHALRRSISLAPEGARSRIALAALLVNERRYREALAEYRALEELDAELPPEMQRAIPRAIRLLRAEIERGRAAGASPD